jgi:hypothetical protein
MIAMQRFGQINDGETTDCEGMYLFKDLDDAYLGLAKTVDGPYVAIYSKEKIINLLKFRDGLSSVEAARVFHDNIQSQNSGPGTPLILNDCCD